MALERRRAGVEHEQSWGDRSRDESATIRCSNSLSGFPSATAHRHRRAPDSSQRAPSLLRAHLPFWGGRRHALAGAAACLSVPVSILPPRRDRMVFIHSLLFLFCRALIPIGTRSVDDAHAALAGRERGMPVCQLPGAVERRVRTRGGPPRPLLPAGVLILELTWHSSYLLLALRCQEVSDEFHGRTRMLGRCKKRVLIIVIDCDKLRVQR